MTPSKKAKLLARIGAGMDTDSAAAELGIPVSDITNCTKAFTSKIDEAARAGSARLRGRLFKNALRDGDQKYLQDILDRRAQAGANQPISRIERHIIDVTHCPKCKHRLVQLPSVQTKPSNGAAHD